MIDSESLQKQANSTPSPPEDRRSIPGLRQNEGLWDWNLATNRIHFSPRWISMLGCSENEVGNTPDEWFRRIHPEDVTQVRAKIDTHLAGSGPIQFENQHRMLHTDGTYRWMACRGTLTRNEQGQSIKIAGAHADVTAEMVSDALTGLPNRLLLTDRLARSVERAKRHNDFFFAALVLDLDRFNALNERLGKAAGDQLLIAVARRLETCLRAGDTVARFGRDHVVARLEGDEFTILLDLLNDVGEAKTVAERLLREVSAPLTLGGHEVFVTASIGIAVSPTGYSRPDEVLRDADIAVHRAKSLGRARCEVFDTAIVESAVAKLQLENDLEWALTRQEFSVFYQPIVSLASNRIEGFEALVRWNHPSRGLVPPLEFIPIAERTGLIVPIGQWVLCEACRQLKAWQDDLSNKELWVSVNLSGVQLKQASFVEHVGESLYNTGLEPNGLVLELTESVVMENPDAARSALMQLRVLGARIALDDFGAGYSSLSYLRQLPVDFLKVDKDFIRKTGAGDDFAEIVRSITDLAHQLGLRVITEGIENSGQLAFVRSLNCEYGQGFLFSRPVDSEKASAMLNDRLFWSTSPSLKDEIRVRAEISIPVPETAPIPPEAIPATSHTEEPVAARAARRHVSKRTGLLVGLGALMMVSTGIAVKLRYIDPARLDHTAESRVQLQATQDQPTALLQDATCQNADLQSNLPTQRSDAQPSPSAANSSRILPQNTSGGNIVPKSEAPLPRAAPRKAANVSAKIPSIGPIPPDTESVLYSFPVIHDHVIGSCKGTLNTIAGKLTYVPEKGKDGFSVNNGEYSCSVIEDRLVIKSGSKIYRFKSAVARTKEQNRSELKSIAEALLRARSLSEN
jgi:diguanylate cyclase (GGDEF)-like protein/PAS domain S-box-containing protein